MFVGVKASPVTTTMGSALDMAAPDNVFCGD